MNPDVDHLLAEHDSQLRGRTPRFAPLGAVTEVDGPVVRTHYGTHGTVDFRGAPDADLADLIRRQQAAFAARAEPVEWRVFGHDPAGVAAHLLDAGFAPGWLRPVLICAIDEVAVGRPLPAGQRVRDFAYGDDALLPEIRAMAERSSPHLKTLAELEADGGSQHWDRNLLILETDGRMRAAAWAEFVGETQFVAIGGLTADHPAFLAGWIDWTARRRDYPGRQAGSDSRYFVAEADGDLRTMLVDQGFQQVTTVQTYHWAPPGPTMRMRPVRRVDGDPHDELVMERFAARWEFPPQTPDHGLVEPADSVTWHLAAIDGDDSLVGELHRIIERGLRSCTRPGERVYALNPGTQGYHFDPRLVGRPGQPLTPGPAYPDQCEYRVYTTGDIRLGTFGDPWERSLCVFGVDLLAKIEPDLDVLLGPVLRRGGQNVENSWTFDPPR
ncbi:hypothetical protein Cme02nite_31990 [Catellatospora methionotrophica]|uniref:DUF2716 domain-containing protein n=1 Tax=Catellatospora methionotrophica TaxID=121620 RepID=A0A8J3PF49_9ACTN|nr:DUF2716 domain-containing protein [Catellatospora methionotrophica]GIG14867.1 hypothetical protein Cme02nite_31990 [Catellatospora methionotrophica]